MGSEKYFPKFRKKNAERPMSAEQCVEFLQEKSLVAKLMAEDEITIQISGSSAYYNAETKTVNIPAMKDITPSMFEWFVAHEVSHSINTPSDWYHVKEEDAKVIPVGKKFHTYLNVTEDARIEKIILSKYRGLKNLANKAVTEFLKIDLFSLNSIPMEQRRLSDRLNLHFKTHGALDVPFAEDEIRWVRAFENLESFDDVYDVAKALYEFEQENDTRLPQPELEEDEEEEEEQDSESDDMDLQSDYDSMLSSDEDEDEDGEEGEESLEEEQSQGEQSDQDPSGEQQGFADFDFEPQEKDSFSSYEENMEQFLSSSNVVAKIETVEYVPHNASYVEHVIHPELDELYRTTYGKFNNKFNSIIQNMVESFMRKKQSANYYRSSVSRTGVLNMEKIHEYKYNEDLFLSVVNNRDGDKYGVVFNLDYSGSMAQQILSTVEQTLILAMFCKRVGIPFHVNMFHQDKPEILFGKYETRYQDLEDNKAYFIGDATNVKIIDEKTKKSDMVKAIGHLLLSAAWNNSYDLESSVYYLTGDDELLRKVWHSPFSTLTGTPYNSSVVGLVQDVIPAIRKRCDKLVYINLTDGAPTDNLFYAYLKRNGEQKKSSAGDITTMVVKGKNASIPISMRGSYRAGVTDSLIKEHCDKFVEIFVCTNAQVKKYQHVVDHRLGYNWRSGYEAVENKKSNGVIVSAKDQDSDGPDTYIIFCSKIKEAKEVEIKKTTASLASSLKRTVKASRHYKTIAQIYIDNIVA